MNTSHTPGKWFVNSFQVWAEKEGKRFGTLIASLRNTDTSDTVANADAALIAAAPELLEALGRMLAYHNGFTQHDFNKPSAKAQAEAAIAKATNHIL